MSRLTDDDRYTLLLVDAICGVGFPSLLLAQECERVGMADLNATGTGWVWDRKALLRISQQQLHDLYDGLCESREEMLSPTEPLEDVPEPSRIVLCQ